MRTGWKLATQVVVVLLVTATLLTGGVLDGALDHAAQAHALRPTPPRSAQDGTRFTPFINAPTLPTSAWRPVSSASKKPTLHNVTTRSTGAQNRTPGEQTDLRTAATSTYLNSDGTWTLKAYPVPVHYQDSQGKWQTIDTSIVTDSSDSGYAFGNKANNWHVHFAQSSSAPYITHVQFPSATFAETLNGVADVAPVTNGSRIVYPNVFPGVDLQYTVRYTTVEETLMLHNAQVPTTYAFTYYIPGATATQDAAGDILFTNAQGAIVFTIGAASMFESNAQGVQQGKTPAQAVAMTLAGSGPDYTVTLTPNQSWLTNSSRTFPVAIDPTWSGSDPHTNTTNGNIYADTFDESNNADLSFYTTVSERIGNCSALPSGATGYGTGTNRSYLKFPVSAAPTNARVTSANLALYQTSSYAGATTINVNVIKTAWNATTLTWNNHPTSFLGAGSGTTSTGYNTTINLDVTGALYYWWQAGVANNGLELQYANESLACDFFASDDYGSNLPTLSVNYVQDVTAPGVGVMINGGATSTNNANVTLSPTYSDAGATKVWNSNWSSVNGVTALHTGQSTDAIAANWSVDSAGSQLTSDTTTCGATNCWVQTYFSNDVASMSNWPTFTAMFKTDATNNFEFGVEDNANTETRFIFHGGSNAFTSLLVSTSLGSYTSHSINIPFNPNTWYYGQITFPLSNVGEIYLWPVGQTRPTAPTYTYYGVALANPGLVLQMNGNNGASLYHYYVGNVTISQKDTTSQTTGYGVYGMDFANDGATWNCPAPVSGTWCVGAGRQTGWALSSGDGMKTVSVRSVDNAGNVSAAGSAQIILDTTAPTGSITAPGAGRELRGVVTVQATASDPTASDGSSSGVASVALYLDGQQQVGSAVTGSQTPSFLWDTTNIASGEHTLTAQTTDNAGNSATSAGVIVVVSNTGQASYETYAMRDLPGGVSAGVNVANGDTVVTQQDLDIPSRGPDLALGRSYNAFAPINNLFGWGWTSDLDEGLVTNNDGSVTYRDPDGGLHVFLPNGSGGFVSSPGLFLTLVRNGDSTYTITTRDQSKTTFTSGGYLSSIADRHGNTLTVAYNTSLLPTTVTDATGRQLTITTSNGHITAISAPGSRTYGYAYDGSGNLTDYTDPAGVVTHYSYDGAHRLTKITMNYQSGSGASSDTNVATTLGYDSSNRLVSLVDPLGYDVGVSYGVAGTFTTDVQQLKTNSTTTPSSSNSVYETTSYLAASDGSGAVTKITDPLNGVSQYQYSASTEQVTQETDPDGHVTTYTYDANGNELTQVVDPNGLKLTTTWTYDSANNMLTETDPRGLVTQYTYDSPTTGNVVKEVRDYVSGQGSDTQTNVTTTYTYDGMGEMITETDPLGVVTSDTYDGYGDLTQTIANYQSGVTPSNVVNVTTSSTYDALGEQLTSTNALGIVTQNVYDIRGNVLQTTQNYVSGGATDSQTNVKTTTTYDALGRPITSTNARSIVTQTTYDADGRVTKTVENYVSGGATDSQINVTSTTAYDAAGNATLATDAKGNTTTTTYDNDNRATESLQQASAQAGGATISDSKTTYDATGLTLSTQTIDNANNPITSYTYDAAGRKATETDPPANPGASDQSGQSNVTTTRYDADGNAVETKVTNSAVTGLVSDTKMSYDKLNRSGIKTEQAGTPDAQTTSYGYDAASRQTRMIDPAGHVTTTAYDALGRTLTVTHPDGTVDTSTYDAAGERLTQSNSAGKTTDTYDALGRVTTEQRYDSTNTLQTTVTTSYDANGNTLTQTTQYASNGTSSSVTRTYDALDRLATQNDGTRNYTYDANGNVTQMQVVTSGNANVVQQSNTYDGGNRLTGVTASVGPSDTTLHSYSYTYNPQGQRTQITTDGVAQTYAYDDAGQLLTVKDSTGATLEAYTYDANHNRTSLTTSAGTTTYTYDSADTQLTQQTDPGGKVTTFAYDTNGNLTTKTYDPTGLNTVTTYKYDGNNRLTEVDNPDGSSEVFTYDADGNRLTATTTIPGSPSPTVSVIKYAYTLGRLSSETDGNGVLLASFVYDSSGAPVSVQVGSDPTVAPRYYYVYNGHGDVTELTDATGTVIASYSYSAFGLIGSASETFPGGWTNPYRYDGRDGVLYDAPTSLYWMSVRAYDPNLGRFISRDPLGRVPLFFASQPYGYAGNNPIMNVDPSGQFMQGANGARNERAAARQARRTRMYYKPGTPHKTSCMQDSNCKRHYTAWRQWIDVVFGGGLLLGVATDILVFASEGIPLIGEIAAIVAGNFEMLGSGLLHLADVVFAANDFIRVLAEIFGAQPDGALVTFLRALEEITGTLDMIANLIGGIFALFNPLQGLEGVIQKFLLPRLEPGFLNMTIFLLVHLGLAWLPSIMGLGQEGFDEMSPNEVMNRYPWMLTSYPPTILAGH